MTSAATPLSVARDARGVVTLTLNDPARFNALGSEMLTALQQALDAVAHDDSARVVVLAAEGKAFCAGHNLKDMAAHPELAWYQQLFSQCSRMMLSIHKLPVPVIAAVDGLCLAGGLEIALCCDLLVMADDELKDSVETIAVNKEVPLWKEGRLILVAKYMDGEVVGEKYRLTNVSPSEMLLVEQELYRRGVRAIAVEHHTLMQGDGMP